MNTLATPYGQSTNHHLCRQRCHYPPWGLNYTWARGNQLRKRCQECAGETIHCLSAGGEERNKIQEPLCPVLHPLARHSHEGCLQRPARLKCTRAGLVAHPVQLHLQTSPGRQVYISNWKTSVKTDRSSLETEKDKFHPLFESPPFLRYTGLLPSIQYIDPKLQQFFF